MTCLEGTKSSIVHYLLLLDVLLYIFYAAHEHVLTCLELNCCCGCCRCCDTEVNPRSHQRQQEQQVLTRLIRVHNDKHKRPQMVQKTEKELERVRLRERLYQRRTTTANRIVAFFLNINLFVIFFISLLNLLGEDASWQVQTAGVGIGALLSVLMVLSIQRVTLLPLYEFVFTSVLLMSAQLTNTYVPQYLNSQYGLAVTTGTALTLVIPVVVLYLLKSAAQSDLVSSLCICIALSLFVVLAESLWRHSDPSWLPDSTVCCTSSDDYASCPVLFSSSEFALVAVLFLLLALLRLNMWLIRTCTSCMDCLRFCCCWCVPQRANEDDDDNEEEEEECRELIGVASASAELKTEALIVESPSENA